MSIAFFFNSVKWVIVDGVEYRKGAGVVYSMENDLPLIGQIIGIVVVDEDTIFLEVNGFSTYYHPHFQGVCARNPVI